LGFHVSKKIKVFLGNCLSHGRRKEIAGESGGHKQDQGEGNGKKSEVVSESGVEKREEVKKEDGTYGEEKRISERKRNGKFGERRTKKFTNKRDFVVD